MPVLGSCPSPGVRGPFAIGYRSRWKAGPRPQVARGICGLTRVYPCPGVSGSPKVPVDAGHQADATVTVLAQAKASVGSAPPMKRRQAGVRQFDKASEDANANGNHLRLKLHESFNVLALEALAKADSDHIET
jgi:hypothetical protein